MLVESCRPRPLAIFLLTVACERNESHSRDRIARAQLSGNFITINLWQSHIEQHDLRSQAFDRLKGGASGHHMKSREARL
jgi:hypothetical protein